MRFLSKEPCIDNNQDIFRELGGIDLLIECLTKHKEFPNEVVACLAKVVNGNSKTLCITQLFFTYLL